MVFIMSKRNKIIDGRFYGSRVSLSIDAYLYELFSYVRSNTDSWVREEIGKGTFSDSRSFQRYVIRSIAKPSLVSKADNRQMDIEDL